MSEIKLSGYVEDSITDGPGLRLTVFVQGCPHHCKGCHNPATHDFNGGRIADTEEIFQKATKNPLYKGVTFSGGEPLCQAKALLPLAKRLRAETKLDLVLFTGYTLEEVFQLPPECAELVSLCTLVVDGRFEESQKDLTLRFRGSANQRLLDGKQSVAERRPIPWKDPYEIDF